MDNNVEKRSVVKQYLEDVSPAVQDSIYSGEKIKAIKALRDEKGLGLKEAKEEAERIEEELRELSPDGFTAKQGSGCMGVIVMAIAVAMGLGYLL